MTDTTTLIGRYFSLAPQADVDAYFAQFAEDAIVEDEGVQRVGIDAIRAWRTQIPRVAYTVHDIITTDTGHDAHVDIAGDFSQQPRPADIPLRVHRRRPHRRPAHSFLTATTRKARPGRLLQTWRRALVGDGVSRCR